MRRLSIEFRATDTEKMAFQKAGRVAGLDLSNWIRSRLRAIANTELTAAGKPVAFMAEQE